MNFILENQKYKLTGLIYKICHKDENIKDIYIGSTFLDIKSRMRTYRTEYNRGYNKRLYKFMRDNGGISSFNVMIIDKIETNMKRELLLLERKYQDQLKPTLNVYKAGGKR